MPEVSMQSRSSYRQLLHGHVKKEKEEFKKKLAGKKLAIICDETTDAGKDYVLHLLFQSLDFINPTHPIFAGIEILNVRNFYKISNH